MFKSHFYLLLNFLVCNICNVRFMMAAQLVCVCVCVCVCVSVREREREDIKIRKCTNMVALQSKNSTNANRFTLFFLHPFLFLLFSFLLKILGPESHLSNDR